MQAVKNVLGPPAETLIQNKSQELMKKQKELKDLQISDKLLRDKNEAIEKLHERLKMEQAKVDQLKDGQEYDAEIKRKTDLIKNMEKDLKSKKKEAKELEKKMKKQQNAREKIEQLESSISKEVLERNELEERLFATKSFDSLKEQESNLQRQNEEDRAIIEDETASPSDKEAAEERFAARNEELVRLQTQIAEREAALPLRERVKEIFKKYGVTLTAIFLAAGATIGAVIATVTNALKKLGTDLGNGLKTLGAKAASALPGIIGAIVSFLFKAAGSAIGFIAEHTWLLILAVVAFLFQKLR